MNCATAGEYLLEAELTELRGEGDGELAQHLRACAVCRERARRIVEQTAALAAELARVVPATAVGIARQGNSTVRTKRFRPWAVAVPLALAASLAVWFLRSDSTDEAPMVGALPPRAVARMPLDVEAPAGQAVAIFQTDNPDIVIIWSF